MTQVTISEEPELDIAVIRRRVPMAELVGFFDEGLSAVMSAIQGQGATPTGPPFARYFGIPEQIADLELGFPVAQPIAPAGEVVPGKLPAGMVYQAVHLGPYDSLGQAYQAILERMAADGVTPGEQMWETYLTDPSAEPDSARWQTRLCWPFGP